MIAPPGARERRELVLVLGMHRSGTSALAGLLARLGVELGQALLPASPDNSAGYFENEHAVATHEALFASLGREWHDPRPLPDAWQTGEPAHAARDRIDAMLDILFAAGRTVAVKDPRACRLVPLWLDVARDTRARASAVISLRHPDEVAASLSRRDGMSPARAHLLWMVYLLESERATRGIARVFVEYDALLGDWRAQVGRIESELGLGLSTRVPEAAPSIDAFLDRSLRHHQAGRAAPPSAFRDLALELHTLSQRCASGDTHDTAQEFDRIAKALAEQAGTYFAAIDDALALELPMRVEGELHRTGLVRHRIDAALQMAALRELWRPTAIAREPGTCKLYYSEPGADFDEGRSLWSRPEPADGGGLSVRFELPAGSQIDRLRIDPDDAPGVFSIDELRIDGQLVEDLLDRALIIHEFALPLRVRQPVLRLASQGDDPHITLDVGDLLGAASDRTIVVEMRFHTETVASELCEQLQAAMVGPVGTLEARVQSLRDELELKSEANLAAALTHAQTLLSATHSHAQALTEHVTAHSGMHQKLLSAMEAQMRAVDDRLAALEQNQRVLLRHAQRRSIGYWWNRLLGRGV